MQIGASPKLFTRVVVVVWVAALSTLLAGCSPFGIPLPGAYTTVDEVSAKLLESAGTVLVQAHYGGALVGDDASLMTVVGGADAAERLEEALIEADYVKIRDYSESTRWSGSFNNHNINVILRPMDADDQLRVGGSLFTIDQTGAALTVSQK